MKLAEWLPSFARYDGRREPVLLRSRSSTTLITFAVSTAIFTDIFLYGVIVPVIPFALEQRCGVHPDQVQYWVSVLLAVYGAALLGASPPLGWLADHSNSRRTPLIIGLLVLIGATALLAIGTSITVLIIGRALQGLSGAVVWIVCLALLVDTVGQDDIGQYMGYVAISLSLAFLMAPLLGGVVFAEQGYEAVFAMAWGLLGVDIFLRLILIERKFARGWLRNCGSHNDTVVAAGPGQEDREEVAINSDEKANQEKNTNTNPQEKSLAQNHPFQSLGTPASAHTADPRAASPHPTPRPFTPPGAVVLPPRNITLDPPPFSLLNLILPSRRSKPLPPLLQLCTSPRLLVALYSTAIQGALITSLDSTLPIYVRQLFGWDSLGAGLVFLPLVLPSFLSPVVGWLTDRYGPRWLTTIGFLLGMPFLVALRVVDEDGLQMKIALCGLLAGLGVALAMVLPPVMAEISYVVDAMEREKPGLFGSRGAYAQAYGLFNMAFAAGTLIGPIWGGMVKTRIGWGGMGWTLGLLSVTTTVPAVLLCGGWIGDTMRKRRREEQRDEDVLDEERGREGGR